MEPLQPGVYFDIAEDRYHKDELGPHPSLNASMAQVLAEESPIHCWHRHPRLGAKDDDEKEETEAMKFGTVAHKLILGRGREIAIGEWDSWRTNEAKGFAASAKTLGQVPCLRKTYDRAAAMQVGFASWMEQLKLRSLFDEGQSEVVALAKDELTDPANPIWLRAMIDKLTPMADGHQAIIWDVKATACAEPRTCIKQISNMWYDQRVAHYLSVAASVMPKAAGRIRYVFLFAETKPPFAVTPIELNGEFRQVGQRRWRRAVAIWRRCMMLNFWPGYADGDIFYAAPPAFAGKNEDEADEGTPCAPRLGT